MPHIDPLISSNFYNFVQARDIKTSFECPINREGKTVEVKPVIYLAKTNNQENEEAKIPNERVTAFCYQGNENKSLLRIVNVADFIPRTDAALTIESKNYHLLQKLGITQNIDQTLTAKIIGLIGDYRFRVLKDHEQYLLRTTLFPHKELICQNAFERLEALQIVERSFGREDDKVIKAMDDYVAKLDELLKSKTDFAKTKGRDWKNILNQDPSEIQKIINNSNDQQKKLFLRHCLALLADREEVQNLRNEIAKAAVENASNPPHPIYGTEATKFPIEKFVRLISNRIVDDAKIENELCTIANGKSTFRGVLENSLGRAERLCNNFTFNQTRLIEPEHQGIYNSPEVTVLASHSVGSSREELRKFLLASGYFLNRKDNDPNNIDTDCFNPAGIFLTQSSRGWTRLTLSEQTDRTVFKTYNNLRQLAAKANVSRLKTAAEDVWKIGDVIKDAFSKAARGIMSAFGREFYKLAEDYMQVNPSANQRENTSSHSSDVTESANELLKKENWENLWTQARKNKHGLDNWVRNLNIQDNEFTPAQIQFIQMLRRRVDSAPLALPPTHLGNTDPDDFLSSAVKGIEAFYYVFDEIYEINPCIAIYASLLYAIGGIAAVNPTLATTILKKINLDALAAPIISWNTATANAMSSGGVSSFVSAGFTAWQEFYLASGAIIQGGDSTAAEACHFMNHHFLKVLGLVAGAYGLGYFITTDIASHIPVINVLGAALKKDVGDCPYIEEFFAGVKLGALFYESLQSKPGGQSVAANMVSFALKCALYPVRLFSSLINFCLGHWTNAAKPWKELFSDIGSGTLRVIDASLRILNLAGQMCKRLIKTVTEWVGNTLTIVFKWLLYPIVKPENNKLTEGLILAKTFLLSFFGKATFFIKNIYRNSRNEIARELRPSLTPVSTPSSHREVYASLNANTSDHKDAKYESQSAAAANTSFQHQPLFLRAATSPMRLSTSSSTSVGPDATTLRVS